MQDTDHLSGAFRTILDADRLTRSCKGYINMAVNHSYGIILRNIMEMSLIEHSGEARGKP